MRNRAFVVGIAVSFTISGIASSPEAETHTEEHTVPHEESHQGKFRPGDLIFGHIADAHEWHIITYKGKHISIPLPVILYSKSTGLHLFSYARFHHGHDVYAGFKVIEQGNKAGKIAEVDVKGQLKKDTEGNYILPIDFSITKNVVALFASMILLFWMFISVANVYKKNPKKSPKGLQSWLEPVILFIRDEVAKPSIGHNYERFVPYLLSIFFFIWFNNMMGLIPIPPGGANLTGNIAITAVLAAFTFLATTLHGNKNYWKHVFNTPGVPWWLKIPIPLMPIIEIMGMFTKPFVLMVRLFANIAAGHIIVLGFFCLIFIFGEISPAIGYGTSVLSVAFAIFMSMLELLVAFIQAYVFTLLSAIFLGMAVEEHH